MGNTYFSIRENGKTNYFVSTDFQSITEVIGALSGAFDIPVKNEREPGSYTAHLKEHLASDLRPTTEEEWGAQTKAFKEAPCGDRFVELDMDYDYAHLSDWGRGGKQMWSISGILYRIMAVYDAALISKEPLQLDEDKFVSGLYQQCSITMGGASFGFGVMEMG